MNEAGSIFKPGENKPAQPDDKVITTFKAELYLSGKVNYKCPTGLSVVLEMLGKSLEAMPKNPKVQGNDYLKAVAHAAGVMLLTAMVNADQIDAELFKKEKPLIEIPKFIPPWEGHRK